MNARRAARGVTLEAWTEDKREFDFTYTAVRFSESPELDCARHAALYGAVLETA